MARYVCVLAGGGVGALARYLLGKAIEQRFPNQNFVISFEYDAYLTDSFRSSHDDASLPGCGVVGSVGYAEAVKGCPRKR